MEEYDKTKENLRLQQLEDDERKRLYNKFVDAGGEVPDDRKKRRNFALDREKQRRFQEKLDSRPVKTREKKRQPQASVPKAKPESRSSETSAFAEFFNRLRIRINLRFMRVAVSGGFYFHKKFLERFNKQFRTALIELQLVYLEIFKQDYTAGARIIERLDSLKPLYYELIEMTGELYSKIIVDQITDHYENFSAVPKKVYELKEPLMELYRRLYVLKPYENSTLNAMEAAVRLHKKIEKEKNPNLAALSKKISSNLFIVFHKLYPRLHLLFCYYHGKLFDEMDPEIEKLLGINPGEKPGSRIKVKNESLNDSSGRASSSGPADKKSKDDSSEEIEEEEDKAESSVSPVLSDGYRMLEDVDFSDRSIKKYDKERLFENIPENDKLFYTFMYFSEFDHEYSALLTTSKVKYYTDPADRSMINFKPVMLKLYDDIRGVYEAFRDYSERYARYEKLKRDRPIGSSGYIDYSKKLDFLNKKMVESGTMARMKSRALMEAVSENTGKLIGEDNPEQAGENTAFSRYIENPEEILEFDAVEGNEKLNNKKIIDAFKIVYKYSTALAHRLSLEGDLSGELQFDPEKMPEQGSSGQAPAVDMVSIQEVDSDAVDGSENDQKKKKSDSGSVLEELDDFL